MASEYYICMLCGVYSVHTSPRTHNHMHTAQHILANYENRHKTTDNMAGVCGVHVSYDVR